jgi:chromosome segregation ATPase
MTAPNIRTVDALTGERAPEKFFQALAEADARIADDRDADALRAENEELRCRVQELEGELGETRLQLDERIRSLSAAQKEIARLKRGLVKL